jgi:hypothetical protein
MTDQPAAAAATSTPVAAPAGTGARSATHRMTPSEALSRHVEWLEFALAAARSEETWRVGRLEKATKRNRERRTARLAEVRDEIDELSALLEAILNLQVLAGRTARARSASAKSGACRPAPPRPSTPPIPRRRPGAAAGPATPVRRRTGDRLSLAAFPGWPVDPAPRSTSARRRSTS